MYTELDLPAAVRRDRIVALVEQQGFVRVADLSDRFGTSEVTTRADLDALARALVVQRIHGGAIALSATPAPEMPFEQTSLSAADQKRSIGVAAAALVQSGQAVVLDVGTTTAAIATALAGQGRPARCGRDHERAQHRARARIRHPALHGHRDRRHTPPAPALAGRPARRRGARAHPRRPRVHRLQRSRRRCRRHQRQPPRGGREAPDARFRGSRHRRGRRFEAGGQRTTVASQPSPTSAD